MSKYTSTLYARLAIFLTVIFLVVGIVSGKTLLNSSEVHQRLVTQHMHCELAKHVVKEHLLFNDEGLDLSAAKMTFMNLMVLGPNFEFYVLGPDGEIKTYSADPGVVKRDSVDITPVKQFLAALKTNEIGSPIMGDNPRDHGQQKIFSAAPIIQNGETLGYLYVILGSDIFDSFSQSFSKNNILRTGMSLVVAGLVFSLLAILLVIGMITRPLRRLNSEVMAVTSAGFIQESGRSASEVLSHWKAGSSDEFHSLGSSFKALLDQLEEQYKQVISVDELRKELLTHISHDLRTPLASLLGYLETWSLNHTQIPKEQSDEYIAIARRNAQKIANLIEQLFELAHLDSGNVRINRETFSVAELAHDVMQKFAIEALEKGVALSVEPNNPRILVQGDIEKLERAFTNLIENALRHTPKNGEIIIRLSKTGRFVGIDVSDTGIGIPEEDIPHIFDAHFKAGNSVRGNSAHGGIGLAITKKIIALHQSDISVKSQVDRGTTFSFTLPFAPSVPM